MQGNELLELDGFLLEALREDAPFGDKTSELLIDEGLRGEAYFLAKEELVVCGIEAALRTFELMDDFASGKVIVPDGRIAGKGKKIATVKASVRTLLLCERTALNLLQRLSGIATMTKKAADLLRGGRTALLDTRKTTPLMRRLEKYAVRTGGGHNHRMGLSDGILIKDNHIAAVGSVKNAVERARRNCGSLWKIEVEVRNMKEFGEAVKAGADVILLDNMSDGEIERAVAAKPPGVSLEVSGGVTLARLEAIARTGVDFVSMGALTHSAPSSDISLEISAIVPGKK